MNVLEKNPIQGQLHIAANQQEKEQLFWANKFSNVSETITFPYDKPRVLENYEKGSVVLDFNQELNTRLWSVSNNNPKALHLLLLSAVATVLYKYTGKEELVIGTSIYKQQNNADKLVNTILPIKLDFKSEAKFKDMVMASKTALLEAIDHQNYPMEVLLENLRNQNSQNLTSLFDVSVILEELHNPSYLKRLPHNMSFVFKAEKTSLQLNLEYNTQLYTEKMIKTIVRTFNQFLVNALENLHAPIQDIALLNQEEKTNIFRLLDNFEAEYPKEENIVSIFKKQVARNPKQIALRHKNQELTYGQLDEWSDHIATQLLLKDLGAKPIVAICLHRSLEMIAAILGILKSNATYLPLAADAPVSRNSGILNDSGASLLITGNDYIEKYEKAISCLNIDTKSVLNRHKELDSIKINPESTAYIIYTSGTTGKPKGVMISHKNVIRLLFNSKFQFDFRPEDQWILFHEYNFDFSVWEKFGALLYGATLHIIEKELKRDFESFRKYCVDNKITVLNQTPTAFVELVKAELNENSKALQLRYVIFGGEALKPATLGKFKNKYPETKLINMYGITETTVHSTFKEVSEEMIATNTSNVGKLLPTLYGYVVSACGSLLPVGVPGELWLGGDGLGKGYINNKELTQQKYITDPFRKDQRVYRSGDIVKMTDAGELIYIGRSDNQIQLRGHRVEIGEIESVILNNNKITDAFLMLKQRNELDVICAYWVGEETMTVKELRAYLEENLPDYMIPAYLIKLESLPMNANGKIDVPALPDVAQSISEAYKEPTSQTEKIMAQIWEKILSVDNLSVDANYFHSGGDSIIAIKLLNEINTAFTSNLKVADIYTYDTIEQLSKKIDEAQTQKASRKTAGAEIFLKSFKKKLLQSIPELAHENIEDILPMSDIEKGMVYYSLKDPESVVYHEQVVIDVKYEDFEESRFMKALQLTIEKHPIFRTSYLMEKEAHIIHKNIELPVSFYDIADLSIDQQKTQINTHLDAQKKTPFDISVPPLWRMALFNLGNNYHVLVFELHHAILDGWSQATFFTELNNLYIKLKETPDYQPDALAVTYQDFIKQELLEKKRPELKKYWKTQLQDYKRLDFLNNTADTEKSWKRNEYALGDQLFLDLQEVAKNHNTTVKHLCFAAYVYSMFMLSENYDLTLGLTSNNRPLSTDSEKLIGCFLNTIPVRVKLNNQEQSWSEYITYIDQILRNAKKYDKVSLMHIMKITGEASFDENPFFDSKFNFIDFHVIKNLESEKMSENEATVGIENFINENTLFDIHINNTWKNLLFSCVYCSEVVSDQTAARLGYYYKKVLENFVNIPQQKALKSSVMEPSVTSTLLEELTNTDYPENLTGETFSTLFQKRVQENPNETAIIYQDTTYTYAELDARSTQLAAMLLSKNSTSSIIPLIVERSPEMIIGIFGILKAGMAYLPIDPGFPEQRIHFMLKDSGSNLVLTKGNYIEKLPETIAHIDLSEAYENDHKTLSLHTNPKDLAYVIYTSGSTGTPKGVMIDHTGLINRLKWMQRAYPLNQNGRILQKTPFTFDVSVWELIWWAIEGKTVVLLPPGEEKNPEALLNAINNSQITTMHFVPSMMRLFLESIGDEPMVQISLKTVFSSGEALDAGLAANFLKTFPDTRLINLYGPTEATIDVSFHEVKLPVNKSIPIGKPIDNISLYVLDKALNIQDKGITGELFISGSGLAKGYLNRPGLTSEKFIYHKKLNKHLYATGDRVFWNKNNELEYVGRNDNQVKIRGVRIELGEIEKLILEIPQVKNAAVIAKKNRFEDNKLVAFVILQEPYNSTQLRKDLKFKMPDYFMPDEICVKDTLPVNTSGKLDRKMLYNLSTDELSKNKEKVQNTAFNEMEEIVAAVWSEILEKDGLDPDVPIFQLGGNSINAVRIVIALKAKIKQQVHVKDIFRFPTIRTLAAYLNTQETESI